MLTGSAFVGANPIALWVAVIGLALITVPLMIGPFRRSRITAPLLRFYTRILPPLSATERTALEAGTVGFEGELFSGKPKWRSEEHTSELQSLMRISYAVFCLKKKKKITNTNH